MELAIVIAHGMVTSFWELLVKVCAIIIHQSLCLPALEKCQHGDIKLEGGSNYATIGRVDVCVNGVWGSICWSSFDNNDASVICTQLGYSRYGRYNIIIQK